MLLQRLRRGLRSVGLDIRGTAHVPFGVCWENDLRWAEGSSLGVVLDVGANRGQTAIRILQAFAAGVVHSFEPVPSTYLQLVRAVKHLSRVVPHNLALGDTPGHAPMQAKPGSGGNSLINRTGETVDVEVSTIDLFCARERISRVSLLKIDTEGYEPRVLAGARDMLERTDNVLVECEFMHRSDEPHGDFFALHPVLVRAGLKLIAFYSGGVDGRTGWVWGDVLYSRLRGEPRPITCSPHRHGVFRRIRRRHRA